jgi:hypothetical protein
LVDRAAASTRGTVIASVGADHEGGNALDTDAGMKGYGVDPNQLKSDAEQRMRDTLRSLGHPTN